MTLESIEKLLSDDASLAILEKRLLSCTGHSFIGDALNAIAEEIESEIAERYMLLPVDADGVPIHVGDILERVDGGPSQQACCIGPYGFNDAPIWCARDFRHVKQRTVEDVLRDVVTLCANTWKDEKSAFRFYGVDNVMESGNIADFAAELRDLMEVDR